MRRICTCLLFLVLATLGTVQAGNALLDPAALNETAPDKFTVTFETTKGDVVVEVDRALAPIGADRFYNLVKNGFYDGCKLFRVVPGFVVQFGMNGSPEISKAWQRAQIKDEPVKETNTRGTISYAKGGPNSRTTQVFINLGDNARLDNMGFSPFGRVIEGMDVVEAFYAGYQDAPTGQQPLIAAKGNAYLETEFPKLDYIKKAVITPNAE